MGDIGYLFNSDTRIDERAGFLEKYASVALVTRNGAAVSCRVISSNTAIPDTNIFRGEFEKIRRDDDTAEIIVSGIIHRERLLQADPDRMRGRKAPQKML